MYRKGRFVISLIVVALFFMPELYSQASSKALEKDVIRAKPRTPIVFDTGRNFVDNARKNKKLKTKIKILHGSSCPSFTGYTSKTRDKREKMLARKRK